MANQHTTRQAILSNKLRPKVFYESRQIAMFDMVILTKILIKR